MNQWHRSGGAIDYDDGDLHATQVWRDPAGNEHKFKRHHIWGHMGMLTRLVPGDYRTYGSAELILLGWRRTPSSSVTDRSAE